MLQNRKIIHIDMDASFAAVEQRDFSHYGNQQALIHLKFLLKKTYKMGEKTTYCTNVNG